MATQKNQSSSNLKKYAVIGGILLVIAVVAFPSSEPPKDGPKNKFQFGAGDKAAKKKVDEYTEEDVHAKFESINATIKNGFVPLVTKGDGPKSNKAGIPSGWANGEGNWTYTGNMVVDGTPNALLENSSNGEGVFLRPGQHWKSLRLVAVKENSIEIEGPNHEMKTISFDDRGTALPSGNAPMSLPPAAIQGNLPQGANPQLNQPGNGGRRNRGQQANQGDQTNADILSGPIGAQSDLESSVDAPIQANNVNTTGINRRIRGN